MFIGVKHAVERVAVDRHITVRAVPLLLEPLLLLAQILGLLFVATLASVYQLGAVDRLKDLVFRESHKLRLNPPGHHGAFNGAVILAIKVMVLDTTCPLSGDSSITGPLAASWFQPL